MRYCCVILILFIAADLLAQQPADSVRADTITNKYLPTGLRVGTDLIALLKTQTQDNFSGWELNADVDFYRYFLVFDYGTWARNFQADSASYSNDGRYWRVGVDVNFLLKDPERNAFFIGARYGRANFSEQFDLIVDDDTWGLAQRDYSNSGVKARWFELTTGIKVRMFKFIWMGYTARFKFALNTDERSNMIPHDVPGYGRTDRDSYWGFNYQLFFRIPFRPTTSILPTKQK